MRPALVLALLAGCPSASPQGECTVDSDCAGGVCARTGECVSPSSVRPVKVTWTIRGSAASPSTCVNSPELYIQFDSLDPQDIFGYSPVPCDPGQFFVDKLPKRYVQVEMGVEDRFLDATAIDALGSASFDLYP
jgi:hypothetical protein